MVAAFSKTMIRIFSIRRCGLGGTEPRDHRVDLRDHEIRRRLRHHVADASQHHELRAR
jgi:hypothetical protein